MRDTFLAGAAVLTVASASVGAADAATVVVAVSGQNNPYLAGAPNGATALGDTAPAQSPTLALTGFSTGTTITFAAVGGFSNTGNTPAASADGDLSFFDMASTSNGISGPQGVRLNGLVGVFLDDSTPGGAAPAQRNDGTTFTTLSPGLRQIFWIGDGLTGTGTGAVQTFFAPTGATRLFLGATDGNGWYNNTGTSTVTINFTPAQTGAVPEPATWGLMLLGFGGMGYALRRRPKAARIRFA